MHFQLTIFSAYDEFIRCNLTVNRERSFLPSGLLSSSGLIRAETFKMTYSCKLRLVLALAGGSGMVSMREL